ncbi:hypothetical protein Hanom_Chr17g01586961 [Helianthus anomalus]
MATRTRSHTGESSETFSQQNILKNPEKEVCAFDNAHIAALNASGAFADKAIIRPFDGNPLVLKVTKNEDEWQRKFFFVRRDSNSEGNSLPVKWLTTGRAQGSRNTPKCILSLYPAHICWTHSLSTYIDICLPDYRASSGLCSSTKIHAG